MAKANNSPEKTFRIGNCSASVFVNHSSSSGKKREFRSVTVQRSFLDGDERKFVSSFGLNDLPAAIRVLQLAQQHIEDEEVIVSE